MKNIPDKNLAALFCFVLLMCDIIGLILSVIKKSGWNSLQSSNYLVTLLFVSFVHMTCYYSVWLLENNLLQRFFRVTKYLIPTILCSCIWDVIYSNLDMGYDWNCCDWSVLWKRCSSRFRKILTKTPVLESLF